MKITELAQWYDLNRKYDFENKIYICVEVINFTESDGKTVLNLPCKYSNKPFTVIDTIKRGENIVKVCKNEKNFNVAYDGVTKISGMFEYVGVMYNPETGMFLIDYTNNEKAVFKKYGNSFSELDKKISKSVIGGSYIRELNTAKEISTANQTGLFSVNKWMGKQLAKYNVTDFVSKEDIENLANDFDMLKDLKKIAESLKKTKII